MPFFTPEPDLTETRGTSAGLPAETPIDPGAIMDAALRQNNSVVSTVHAVRNSQYYAPEEGHNSLDLVRGTIYEQRYLDRFAGSRSQAEDRHIMAAIDSELADQRILEGSGKAGVVAGFVAGTFDPTLALPGGVAIQVGRDGVTFLKAALQVGKAALVQSSVQEGILTGTQQTRTVEENLLNVGSATLLAAFIGGAASKLLTPVEHAAAVRALDRDRAEMNVHAGNGAPVGEVKEGIFVPTREWQVVPEGAKVPAGVEQKLSFEGAPSVARLIPEGETTLAGQQAQAAGAAATDTRELELVPTGVKLEQLRDNPQSRAFNSPSISARRAMADLSESPLEFKEAAQGITPTLEGGPALDRLARWSIDKTRVTVSDKLNELWKELRFGSVEQAPFAARGRETLAGFLGRNTDDVVTFEQFKSLVSEAMINDDKHAIPQVERAAQYVRQQVFDPWKERAIKAGLLPEDVDVKTADSYMQRVYNKQAIAAKRPEFVNVVQNWLKSDQETKAGAKDRLTAYSGALDVAEEQSKKLAAKIEQRQAALEELEARGEEVQRFNKFAFKRSEDLSEPLDAMREHIRTIQARIQPQTDRLAQLAEDIRAQKERFPEIKEADSLIFKMIGAAQKLKQSKEIIDAIEAASEYVDALDATISGFKGGIRDASAAAKLARRELGADTLVSLEKARADVTKEVAPLLKQLNTIKRALKEERAARIPKAQGGAVFETEIRRRGNILADRASGRDAELADLEAKFIRETDNATAMRTKIEEELGRWEGKSSGSAKSAISAREKYRQEALAAGKEPGAEGRLAGADTAVDDAVRAIMKSDRDWTDAELRERAHQITERILGSPDGRLPYAEKMGEAVGAPDARGPLAAREFNIPDKLIREFLERDIEQLVTTHLRTMVPDVLLTERFGDVNMTEAFRKIEDDYAALIDQTKSGKEREKLNARRERDIKDLAGVRDRIRGVYGVDVFNSMRGMARAAQAVKNLNIPLSMGMAAVSSLPDLAGPIFRHGLGTVFRDAWAPFANSLAGDRELTKEAARQFRAMGLGVDRITAQRHRALTDIMEGYKPNSRFERTLQWGADKFMLLNLLGHWTDAGKIIAATVASQEFFRAAEAVAKGTATQRQVRALASGGIDAQLAERIAKQYRESGNIIDGVHLPNTEAWTDAAARQAFEGAVHREADIAVVTPGQEKPLLLSNPVLNVLFQFKSFTAASTQRILIANLQRRDAQVLQGVMFSMGLGMTSYKLNSMLGGQPASDRPQDWIKEGLSRGSILGWLEEGNALASKATRGGVDIHRLYGADKPLSRYAGRSVVDQLLGPTAGKIDSLTKITGAAGSAALGKGEWSAADTTAVRKLVAFQNLFYLRSLFNQVEAGVNEHFGVPPKPEPKKH